MTIGETPNKKNIESLNFTRKVNLLRLWRGKILIWLLNHFKAFLDVEDFSSFIGIVDVVDELVDEVIDDLIDDFKDKLIDEVVDEEVDELIDCVLDDFDFDKLYLRLWFLSYFDALCLKKKYL